MRQQKLSLCGSSRLLDRHSIVTTESVSKPKFIINLKQQETFKEQIFGFYANFAIFFFNFERHGRLFSTMQKFFLIIFM